MPSNTINCPICGSTMLKKHVAGGIEIDYCEYHGVWLDVGELEQMFAASNSSSNASQPMINMQSARSNGVSKGKGIAKGLGGAVVMGAGFSIGHRLVGSIVDALFDG